MNKKKISSTKILQESEQYIKGDFDLAVEIEYEKSQVTERSAIKNALNEINSKLPKGLSARVSDSEQRTLSSEDKEVRHIGLNLFTDN
jgi:transketolase